MPKELMFDKRLIERNLRQGQVRPEELQRHLEALPDRSNQVREAPEDTSFDVDERDDLS